MDSFIKHSVSSVILFFLPFFLDKKNSVLFLEISILIQSPEVRKMNAWHTYLPILKYSEFKK